MTNNLKKIISIATFNLKPFKYLQKVSYCVHTDLVFSTKIIVLPRNCVCLTAIDHEICSCNLTSIAPTDARICLSLDLHSPQNQCRCLRTRFCFKTFLSTS